MTLSTYLLYLAAVALLVLSPGPTMLMCVTNAINHGPRAALLSATGSVTAALAVMLLSVLGLGALLAALAPPGRALAWRPLRGLMGLAGVLGLAVNTSFLLGGPGAPLIGPAVVLTALALLGAGLALGRR